MTLYDCASLLRVSSEFLLLSLQFSNQVLATLSALDKEAESGAWFGGADKSESRHSLHTFLTSFIENAYMPTVFLDFK